MVTKDGGGPAFPTEPKLTAWAEDGMNYEEMVQDSGMTLRQWYAGQALVGVQLAQINGALTGSGSKFLEESDTARAAFQIADAMIAESRK